MMRDEDETLVTLKMEYDDGFNLISTELLDESGGLVMDENLLSECLDFSKQYLKPGDFYEDCRYRPLRCLVNNNGDLEGFDLIDKTDGWACDEDKCTIKLDEYGLKELTDLWSKGHKEVLISKGWDDKNIKSFLSQLNKLGPYSHYNNKNDS